MRAPVIRVTILYSLESMIQYGRGKQILQMSQLMPIINIRNDYPCLASVCNCGGESVTRGDLQLAAAPRARPRIAACGDHGGLRRAGTPQWCGGRQLQQHRREVARVQSKAYIYLNSSIAKWLWTQGTWVQGEMNNRICTL